MAAPPFLVKTPVEVRFGEQEQKRGTLLRLPGQLASAVDVAQAKTGAYGQRNGKTSTDTTVDSGSIATGKKLAGLDGVTVLQTVDTVFARTAAGTQWKNKGPAADAFASWSLLMQSVNARPCSVSTGTLVYHFAHSSTENFWYYAVTEATTGAFVVPPTVTTFTDGGGSRLAYGRAVFYNGFVWFFYRLTNTSLFVVKFDPSTPAVIPAPSAYRTAGSNILGFDVMATTSNPLVVLFITAGNAIEFSLLDSTTSLPKASPGTVAYSASGTVAGVGSILRGGDGSDGNYYVAATFNTVPDVKLLTLAASTLVVSAAVQLGSIASATNCAVCGYLAGNGDKVAFFSDFNASIEDCVTTRFVKPAGAVTSSVYARGRFVSSCPFKIGSSWYLAMCHDDTVNLQRAYYFQDASKTSGGILARTLYQLGGDVTARGKSGAGVIITSFGWVAPDPPIVGGVAYYDAVANLQGSDFSTLTLTFDPAPTIGPMTATPDLLDARLSGGWPRRLQKQAALTEAAPPMYPRTVSVGAFAGTMPNGNYQVAACYVYVDPTGAITRSSPSPQTAFSTGTGGLAITAPTLRAINSATGYYVEFYISLPGALDLFLVKTVANDPTVDSITINLSSTPGYGELLYTSGGTLSNVAPPPHRVSFFWKNRQFVLDTDVAGEIWPSKEIEAGFGVQFSDTQIVRIPGRQRAGGAINDDYAAIFQSDCAYVLYGQGQSDAGTGQNFLSRALKDVPGCTNPASVVTGPGGCYYQGPDGGIYLLRTDLTSVYVGSGVDDHRSATVTGAIHVPKKRHVRFFLDSGKCLVLDYGNVESSPFGKWYVWTNHSAVAAAVVNDVASFVGSDGVLWQETDGKLFDATNTPILWDVTFATLSLAGLAGYQRTYRGHIVGEFKGNHTIQVTVTADGTAQAPVSKAMAAGPEIVEFRPAPSRCSQLDIRVQRTGSDLTDSCLLEGLSLEVGIKPGGRHLNVSQRMT